MTSRNPATHRQQRTFTMRAIHHVNRLSGWLLLVGIAGVGAYNWRQWQREKTSYIQRSPVPPARQETWPWLPKVSVLVAAWNEADNIAEHLQSFLALRYPNKELILCAGGTDGTYDIAQGYAGEQVVVVEQQPGEGKQNALRRCLPMSSGAVIFLTDADCVFADEPFLRIIEPIAYQQAQVVTGTSEPKVQQRNSTLVQYQWFTDLRWSYHMPQTVDGVLGRNCALLRSVLEELGVLNTAVRTGTDYVLSRRLAEAGYTIHTAAQSRIATEYPATAPGYLRMWRRWNKNLLIHGSRFGAWKDVRGVAIASALYSSILLGPLCALVLGPIAGVAAIMLFVTASVNRLRRIASGAQLAGAPLSLALLARFPFYVLLDMIAVLLAVYDALHPRMRTRW